MGYTVPKINVSNLLNAGRSARELFGSVRQDELANAKMAEEQRRWDIANDRLQRKEDRELAEQEALDKYFGIISQGEQVKGGVLNKDSLIAETDKYSFTPEEIAKYDAYKGDAAAARAAGDLGLADKIDWQTNLSRVADKIPESGIANEGRVAMYERARDEVAKAGLPVSKEMAAAVDTARFEEQKARLEKKEEIEKQLSKLSENELEMQKYYGNKIGGGSSFVDEDGNTVSLGSRNKSAKDQTKSIIEGTTALSKVVNDLEGLEAQEKKDAAKIATDTFNLIVSRGVDPTAAAKFIGDGLSTKDTGFLFWAGKEPKINTDMINQFVDTYKVTEAKLGASGGTSVTRNTDKEDYARDLLASTMQGNAAKRAKLQGDLDALNMTSDERMEVGLTELLRKNGVLPEVVPTVSKQEEEIGATGKPLKARINKNIKSIAGIPDSMVASEGVTNEAYKDGNGYSIAMGYNLYYNQKDIDKDFKDANISPEKAFIAKTRPQDLVLDDGEAQRLSQVAYYKYADSLDKQLGGTLDKLSPQMQATALQMHYRGDLFNKADYAKELRKYVKADDYDGLVKYVSENAATLPAPVVRRLENDLGAPVTEAIRGKITEGVSTSSVKDIFSKVKTSEEKDLSSKVDTNSVTTSKDGDTSSEVRALLDALNKAGQGDTDEAVELNSRYAELLKKEKAENKAKKWDSLKEANLFELLGIAPERKRVQAQESLTPEPDASLEEPGLEHDFTWVPGLGFLNKTRNKTSTYDDIYKGVFKADKGRVLDDVLTKDPLRVQDDILRQTFGNKTVDVLDDIFERYASMSRTDLIAEATRLRNIEKPSNIDLAALEKLQQLLRNSR